MRGRAGLLVSALDCARPRAALRRRAALSLARRHEPPRLRTRGVPVLRLPAAAARRRAAFAALPSLAPIANPWHERLRIDVRFPPEHAEFLDACHAAGQLRPTPLLLATATGDYNCLHQDLYGEHVFPLQVTVLLSRPQTDFGGGEFVMTEQRPRMQSRAAGRAARAGRRGDLRRAPPARAGHPRRLSRQPASRRQPGHERAASHARHHLSRRTAEYGASLAPDALIEPASGVQRRSGDHQRCHPHDRRAARQVEQQDLEHGRREISSDD